MTPNRLAPEIWAKILWEATVGDFGRATSTNFLRLRGRRSLKGRLPLSMVCRSWWNVVRSDRRFSRICLSYVGEQMPSPEDHFLLERFSSLDLDLEFIQCTSVESLSIMLAYVHRWRLAVLHVKGVHAHDTMKLLANVDGAPFLEDLCIRCSDLPEHEDDTEEPECYSLFSNNAKRLRSLEISSAPYWDYRLCTPLLESLLIRNASELPDQTSLTLSEYLRLLQASSSVSDLEMSRPRLDDSPLQAVVVSHMNLTTLRVTATATDITRLLDAASFPFLSSLEYRILEPHLGTEIIANMRAWSLGPTITFEKLTKLVLDPLCMAAVLILRRFRLPNLEILRINCLGQRDFHHNPLCFTGWDALSFPMLETLEISSKKFSTGVREMFTILHIPSIRVLKLSGVDVSGLVYRHLITAEQEPIQTLDLKWTQSLTHMTLTDLRYGDKSLISFVGRFFQLFPSIQSLALTFDYVIQSLGKGDARLPLNQLKRLLFIDQTKWSSEQVEQLNRLLSVRRFVKLPKLEYLGFTPACGISVADLMELMQYANDVLTNVNIGNPHSIT